MAGNHNIENIKLDGGWLCLDFVNTVHSRRSGAIEDYLNSYEDFVLWGLTANALDQKDWASLKKLAFKQATKSNDVFSKAIVARENLYELLSPIARNEKPEGKYVNGFNKLLATALKSLEVQFTPDNKIISTWKEELEKPLYIVVKSAYDLLMSDRLDRVKECGACGWLFLDKSKNKSRRWCDMQTCGSSDKARRYYRRKKVEGTGL